MKKLKAEGRKQKAADKERLPRARTIGNLYAKKFRVMELDGIWRDVFGDIEQSGCWLIFGREKNGKSRLSALMAKDLCKKYRVLFISAEEGESKNFSDICKWAGLTPSDRKFKILDYIKLEELKQRLGAQKAPNIVFIDNVTFYHEELKNGGVRELLKEFKRTVFVFIAHEQSGEPYTSTAKMVSKLATAIMHVRGLRCHISGRVPGGVIDIDAVKARLYHGN